MHLCRGGNKAWTSSELVPPPHTSAATLLLEEHAALSVHIPTCAREEERENSSHVESQRGDKQKLCLLGGSSSGPQKLFLLRCCWFGVAPDAALSSLAWPEGRNPSSPSWASSQSQGQDIVQRVPCDPCILLSLTSLSSLASGTGLLCGLVP